MATTALPPVAARPGAAAPSPSLLPIARRGIGAWLTTTDHKKIGLLYMFWTFIFFILGGLAALLVRLQLALP
jgi:hypothetical protein